MKSVFVFVDSDRPLPFHIQTCLGLGPIGVYYNRGYWRHFCYLYVNLFSFLNVDSCWSEDCSNSARASNKFFDSDSMGRIKQLWSVLQRSVAICRNRWQQMEHIWCKRKRLEPGTEEGGHAGGAQTLRGGGTCHFDLTGQTTKSAILKTF